MFDAKANGASIKGSKNAEAAIRYLEKVVESRRQTVAMHNRVEKERLERIYRQMDTAKGSVERQLDVQSRKWSKSLENLQMKRRNALRERQLQGLGSSRQPAPKSSSYRPFNSTRHF